MSTVLVFDLDDTLYPEHTYVKSGFAAVAVWLHARYGWEPASSCSFMVDVLENEGRGAVFNRLVENHGVQSKKLVNECVHVYRHHMPIIDLYPEARRILGQFASYLYLVTDGHKVVQDKKVNALNIDHFFKKVFITHRYGIKNAKPSLHCFECIRNLEKCAWGDMIYVADNPAKDFVNLNTVGVRTIRVLTGGHKDDVAKPGFEASMVINTLNELEISL